eukprot:365304-Chlamydomonas_euryale.AAC.1
MVDASIYTQSKSVDVPYVLLLQVRTNEVEHGRSVGIHGSTLFTLYGREGDAPHMPRAVRGGSGWQGCSMRVSARAPSKRSKPRVKAG